MPTTSQGIHLAFFLLVAATLSSFAIADTGALGHWAMVAMMAITAGKATLVLLEFMELREASLFSRIFFAGWVAIVTLMIAGLNLLA